jgi:hypothetical protein
LAIVRVVARSTRAFPVEAEWDRRNQEIFILGESKISFQFPLAWWFIQWEK